MAGGELRGDRLEELRAAVEHVLEGSTWIVALRNTLCHSIKGRTVDSIQLNYAQAGTRSEAQPIKMKKFGAASWTA